MIQLTPLKPNCNMLETESKIVCVSYKTSVAFYDKVTKKYYKTSKKWSNTTNRHIALFFNTLAEMQHSAFNPETIEQEKLDQVLA